MAAISVIMPAFNAAPFIGAAIKSLAAQTMTDWELIVADDGSTDTTHGTAMRYARTDSRIRVLAPSAPSGSPAKARLRALAEASAEWVFPLDADDIVEPSFLEQLLARRDATGADAVLCRLDKFETLPADAHTFMPAAGFDTAQVRPGRDLLTATFHGWSIPANGLFRREAYISISENVLDLVPDNPYADEHIGRLLIHAAQLVAFSRARYLYRVHSGSVTHAASARRFAYLQTNLLLNDFVRRNYGAGSHEASEANLHVYRALVGALIALGRMPRLSAADRVIIDRWLRRSYRAVDFRTIPSTGPIYHLMRLGLGPARAILSAYGRTRR